jgi:hypothetical protein
LSNQGLLFRDRDMDREEAISVVRRYIEDASDLKTKVGRLNEIKNDERRKNLPRNNGGNGADGDTGC